MKENILQTSTKQSSDSSARVELLANYVTKYFADKLARHVFQKDVFRNYIIATHAVTDVLLVNFNFSDSRCILYFRLKSTFMKKNIV